MTEPHQTKTWQEIHQQPRVWRDWAREFDLAGLRAWIDAQGIKEILLCGAGTSAYIGDCLAAGLQGLSPYRLRSVPTTDIVARPQAFLTGQPKLVVGFGRSGSSAESIGLMQALETLVPDWPRLNVTCNVASPMSTRAGYKVVALPKETHDAGFAMTSSFSTMYLTMLALLDLRLTIQQVGPRMDALAASMALALDHAAEITATLGVSDRIVFLGTGALGFAARESALKVMELTAGKTAALWDTSLGFRHGPKSFVQDGTVICLLSASDPHAQLYERDLVKEIARQFPQNPLVVLPAVPGQDDAWAVPVQVAFAQILGTLWSGDLGLNIDDPFHGRGTLTRVVSGITLYPVNQP